MRRFATTTPRTWAASRIVARGTVLSNSLVEGLVLGAKPGPEKEQFTFLFFGPRGRTEFRSRRPAGREAKMHHVKGREKILELFEARPNQWIPLPTILRLGVAQYNSRILELRRAGYIIENKTEYAEGVKHSWFMFRGKRTVAA
jgi:hypothetical protein